MRISWAFILYRFDHILYIFIHRLKYDNNKNDADLLACDLVFNPLTAKLLNWNFHSLEIVSRWRDSQLQVSENY